jgi:adenylate kinase family enzyme
MQWPTGRAPQETPVRVVVAISGPVRGGKSTLADNLERTLGAHVVRTKSVLIDEYGPSPEMRRRRAQLQELGEKLDRETRGGWVASAVQRAAQGTQARRVLVVDAVRIPQQVDLLRRTVGFKLLHIHVSAPRATLEKRYSESVARPDEGFATYDEVRKNQTEANVSKMGELTWLRFNTLWLPKGAVSFLTAFIVYWLQAQVALRDAPEAFAVGALPAAVMLAPLGWFLSTWTISGGLLYALLATSVALFVLSATLIGAAVTRLSPIERDPPAA